MIKLQQVSKQYPGGFTVLNRVDFQLESAEMVFLIGQSGAGKSTLIKLIGLLEPPSSGQIHINGRSISQWRAADRVRYRQNMGITLQSPHLLPDRSVFDNVALPLSIQGMHPVLMKKRVRSALDKVGLLTKERLLPVHLSGGEQQRVGIARAIVHKPALLIADEPTGNLDPGLSKDIMQLFVQLNQVGVTVMVATHDLTLIASLPYRMIMLKEGCVC